jgi:hypothetical protein
MRSILTVPTIGMASPVVLSLNVGILDMLRSSPYDVSIVQVYANQG